MKHLNPFLLIILLLASAATSAWPDEQPGPTSQLTLADLRTFTDVFEQIRQNYIEEIDDETLLRAAIRGMVAETDSHSSFIDEDEFAALDQDTRGRKGGIGATVMIQQRMLVVESVQEGGPAQQAGIGPGDVILAIDGQAVRGRLLADSIEALGGEPGTELELRFLSKGRPSREVTLTRAWVPVSSVRSEWLEPGIALFRITRFQSDTHLEFHQQLEQLLAGGTPLRGILIDLQHNLGGELQSAVTIADGFLDEGLIVNTRSRYKATQLEYHAHRGQWAGNVPVAILVDAFTASASEVMTAALQDHRRALVVGAKTYGKGSIQSILRLRNGSALRLTTAHYFTPSGRSLEGNGIEPDILSEDGEDRRKQALEWIRSELDAPG
jgi:carboxyl-terminal processing protease